MLAAVVSSPVDALAAAVDALAAESIDTHSTHALAGDLVALRREVDRLEAQFVRRLHRFHTGRGAQAESSPTTVSWLRSTCGLTAAAAADRVRVGRALAGLPAVEETFQAGRASYANISLLGHLVDAIGCEASREIEETMVMCAEKLDPGRMYRFTSYTRHRLDPDGALAQENRNHARRFLSFDRIHGDIFVLRAELDVEGGALVQTALDAMSRKRGPDDRRSGDQRRADALVDMASAMLRHGELPTVHGERPHLVLTSGLDALRGVRGAVPAELQGVGPVHSETARRLTCDASVRIAVESSADGQDRSVSIGRASRNVPAPMRTAMDLRDNGCRYAGCDRPAAWTDKHHARHWSNGGATEMSNLVSLCRFHHRLVHEGGQELRLLPDGTVEVSGGGRSVVPVAGARGGAGLPRLE